MLEMNDGKKVSFSFSKAKKPLLMHKVNKEPKEKIEYVDCFDGSKGQFSFKGNIRNDEPSKQELIIPMVNSKTSTDIVKSRIAERLKNTNGESKESLNIRKNSENGRVELEESAKSIEELAATEILNEIRNYNSESKDSSKLVIQANGMEEISEVEIDYNEVPVNDFGMAMLRGMGWKPNTGIGKEPKMVATVSPKLRPKGLGLGAKPSMEKIDDTNKQKKKS